MLAAIAVVASTLVVFTLPNIASAVAPVIPTDANTIVSADGRSITMTFANPLHANLAPKEQFQVLVGNYDTPATASASAASRTVNVPVTSVVSVSSTVIRLNLDGVIESDKSPTIKNTAPAVDNTPNNFALQDTAGLDGATWTLNTAASESLVPAVEKQLPQFRQRETPCL